MKKHEKGLLKDISLSLLKVGAIGFGGGSALIPVINDEIVEKKKLLSKETYTDHTVISNITPGALPVKLGMLAGAHTCGTAGMLIGAYSVALFGTVLTVLLLSFLSVLGDKAIGVVECASVGISVYIIYLLLHYCKKVLTDSKKQNFSVQAIVIMILSAILTCGKEIRAAASAFIGQNTFSDTKAFFDISTIELLLLAFFVIFFANGKPKKLRAALSIPIGIVYVALCGYSPLAQPDIAVYYKAAMMLLAAGAAVYDAKKSGRSSGEKISAKAVIIGIGAFSAVIAAGALVAIFATNNADIPAYLLNGFVSTVTSFGGGEAYLTVADGIFVAGGIIDAGELYSQILPIANTLPGPILVKILAGIGYIIGYESNGVIGGFATALLGFSTGIGATCIVCIIVDAVYRTFSQLQSLKLMKIWILPVICGLLITTMISMLTQSFSITADSALGIDGGITVIAAVFVLTHNLKTKTKISDVFIILIDGGITLALPLLI